MAEQYLSVGKLGKPHGLSGAFRFFPGHPFKNKKKLPKHFLLKIKGTFVPWFIRAIEMSSSSEGFIEFEDVTSPEKAKAYATYELYLSPKDAETYFKTDSDDEFDFSGYTAIDETTGEIGIIDDVIETPGQFLCSIKRNGKEILIPLVDDLVTKVDKRKKKITFDLPEGLLDL